MFYYLIHNLPWGNDLQPGKRNVRTFITGSVCYILLHALLFTDKVSLNPMLTTVFYMLRRYFWWIVLADAVAMSITYKIAYGRNILTEIPIFQALGEWVGGARGERQPVVPQPRVIAGTGNPVPQNTVAGPKLPPQSTVTNKNTPTQKLQEKMKPTTGLNDEELDIDLLTENESQPDEKTNQAVQQPQTNEVDGEIDDETENEGEPDESGSRINEDIDEDIDDEIDDESKTENDDQQTTPSSSPPEKSSPGPKLTPENITKYVINRSKLKLKNTEVDIKSEDLNL